MFLLYLMHFGPRWLPTETKTKYFDHAIKLLAEISCSGVSFFWICLVCLFHCLFVFLLLLFLFVCFVFDCFVLFVCLLGWLCVPFVCLFVCFILQIIMKIPSTACLYSIIIMIIIMIVSLDMFFNNYCSCCMSLT